MAITHEATKVPGERGFASEWNADHVVDDDSKPKNFTTLIVAASNSLDRTRADYVCDGIDDQETINEAIGDLPAGGGRISLMEGTYQITDSIVLDKDNVTLEGLGASSVIQTTDDISMIFATGRDGLLIASIRLMGKNALSIVQFGIELINCDDGRILDCWLENQGAGAIMLRTCEYMKVTDCFTNNNILTGIYLESCNYCVILNCTSNNNGVAAFGIEMWHTTYCKIIACFTDENNQGIRIDGPADHNIINACTSINNNNFGINITVNSNRNNITSNMVTGNGAGQIINNGANNNLDNNQIV